MFHMELTNSQDILKMENKLPLTKLTEIELLELTLTIILPNLRTTKPNLISNSPNGMKF
jgi:hypothetical protein